MASKDLQTNQGFKTLFSSILLFLIFQKKNPFFFLLFKIELKMVDWFLAFCSFCASNAVEIENYLIVTPTNLS